MQQGRHNPPCLSGSAYSFTDKRHSLSVIWTSDLSANYARYGEHAFGGWTDVFASIIFY
jgi:hypothetical protein